MKNKNPEINACFGGQISSLTETSAIIQSAGLVSRLFVKAKPPYDVMNTLCLECMIKESTSIIRNMYSTALKAIIVRTCYLRNIILCLSQVDLRNYT